MVIGKTARVIYRTSSGRMNGFVYPVQGPSSSKGSRHEKGYVVLIDSQGLDTGIAASEGWFRFSLDRASECLPFFESHAFE